ncbi:uncharacterized protein J3D65DRAFT_554403 [Phyllosticta citribraziliensis]|uniref:NAD(P)-binding domain-containing protein n=1 Tax=Phyllosticta citribraziliensis TaxID=989973 RepID=A0ABR1LKV1_9PEZI
MATTTNKKYDNVIVFGPTGDVGGHAALAASSYGAKVWLAMRTPDKPIPILAHLSPDEEKKQSFTRIHADLTDAASIRAAVQHSGAKAAYVYLVPTADGLASSLAAMRDAGIELVVFLSSFSVPFGAGLDVRAVAPQKLIARAHAAVEANLEDLRVPHVALRPAYFASNPLNMGLDAARFPALEAHIFNGAFEVDCIAPDDIGRVAGALLVAPPPDLLDDKDAANPTGEKAGKKVLYLCGPQLITQDRVFEIIQEVSGRDVAVKHLSKEQWVERQAAHGMPQPVAAYLAEAMEKGFTDDQYRRDMYDQAVANVKEVTGRDAMSFEEYVKVHLDETVSKAAVPGGTFSS